MIFKELQVKKTLLTQEDAQNIVRCAMRYDSDIFFEHTTHKINAKSLMGVISMGLRAGDKIMAIVKGDDQDEALVSLMDIFKKL